MLLPGNVQNFMSRHDEVFSHTLLLEPHLKTRLKLEKYDKIRFQGCRAARHDDHIHVQ